MRWGRRRPAQPDTAHEAGPQFKPDGSVVWPTPQGTGTDLTYLDAEGDGLDDDLELSDAASADEYDAAPTALPASKGGRNMAVATSVGVGLLVVALFAAWLDAWVFAVLVYAFLLLATLEWRSALLGQGRRVPAVPLVLATLGIGTATWFGRAEGLTVAVLVGLAGMVAWRATDERVENTLADSLASMFTLMWIPFLGSFIILMEQADDGWQRVVVFVVAVVGNDTGGLFAGMRWGRHKLAPSISPNKTWEGMIGGVLLGTVAATVAAALLFDGRWWLGTLVGLACTGAAVLGDLAESSIKRDIEVKDMSSLIPGHGGVMDRLDSLLLAAPAAYVIFAAILGTLGGR
ncbi:phosphatidate cytidylyltransferase [Demequina salsinemoris]|uniref:phosphatidate cytidylyltransferase n=1 Tax=Demequina salsinemoris TaxID=577470 RepID=UPI000AEE0F3A|nr:phosphatidate cytidylyltransferase [Demequina salsinemoris]